MKIISIYLTPEALVLVAVGTLIVLIAGLLISRRFFRKVKPKKFRAKWRDLQKKLPDKENWLVAMKQADDLLDEAMKKNKIKGDSMGERLVNAQKLFKDKDEVWFGHKLCKKYQENPKLKLEKDSVKRALLALRQGLKDLGAI